MPPWVLRIRNCGRPSSARVPAHAGVLGQAEEVAARAVEEHLRGQRQAACRSRSHRLDVEQSCGGRRAPDDLLEPDRRPLALSCAHVSPLRALIRSAGRQCTRACARPAATGPSSARAPPAPGAGRRCPRDGRGSRAGPPRRRRSARDSASGSRARRTGSDFDFSTIPEIRTSPREGELFRWQSLTPSAGLDAAGEPAGGAEQPGVAVAGADQLDADGQAVRPCMSGT